MHPFQMVESYPSLKMGRTGTWYKENERRFNVMTKVRERSACKYERRRKKREHEGWGRETCIGQELHFYMSEHLVFTHH